MLPAEPTPTATLPRACVCRCQSTPSKALAATPLKALAATAPVAAATPPVVADGVLYVSYTFPDTTLNPPRYQYALVALRARDGVPLWRLATAAGMAEPVAVADGVLIVSDGETSTLVGLRASDGATLWHSCHSAALVGSSAGMFMDVAPSAGVLYVIDNGDVSALRIADGLTLWQTPVQSGLVGSLPVVDGTSVYVAASNGSVVALQADTGAVRWTAFQDTTASPLVWHYPLATYGGQLYVTASDAQSVNPAVLGLNAADGTSDGFALRLPMYALALCPALTADIFTTVIYPSVPPGATHAPGPTIDAYRLSASGGQLLWSVPLAFAGAFQPTAHDAQTFYVEAVPPGVISAYRLTDGVVRWHRQALATSTPIFAASGYLFEATNGGPVIRALATTNGAVAWTRALDATL